MAKRRNRLGAEEGTRGRLDSDPRTMFTSPVTRKAEHDREGAERYCKRLPVIGPKMRLPTYSELANYFVEEPPPEKMRSKHGEAYVWVEDDYVKGHENAYALKYDFDRRVSQKTTMTPKGKLPVVCVGELTGDDIRAAMHAHAMKHDKEYRRQQADLEKYRERVAKIEARNKAATMKPSARLCPINWSK